MLVSAARDVLGPLRAQPLALLQVDTGETPVAGGNVFDDSDDDQAPASPAEAPQETPTTKSNKLAELANKKRKEMVSQAPFLLHLDGTNVMYRTSDPPCPGMAG